MEHLDPFELGQAVRLQAELEGRGCGRPQPVSFLGRGVAGTVVRVEVLPCEWALAAGRISEEHAAIIVRAAETVPPEVSAQDLADCEERLVEKATRMAPGNLRRAARRLLEPVVETARRRPRASRLFTKAQWLALSATHESCAAHGCDRPFASTDPITAGPGPKVDPPILRTPLRCADSTTAACTILSTSTNG